jgi:hypothetical protein
LCRQQANTGGIFMDTYTNWPVIEWTDLRNDTPWNASGDKVMSHHGVTIAETICPEAARMLAAAPRMQSILSNLYEYYAEWDTAGLAAVERALGPILPQTRETLLQAGADPDMLPALPAPLSQLPGDVALRQTGRMFAASNAIFEALCLWTPGDYGQQWEEWRAQHSRVLTESARQTAANHLHALGATVRKLNEVIRDPASYELAGGDMDLPECALPPKETPESRAASRAMLERGIDCMRKLLQELDAEPLAEAEQGD